MKLIDQIGGLIQEAMKEGDKVKLDALKLIKAELQKAEKSGQEYNEAKLLLKMVQTWKNDVAEYEKAGRTDLSDEAKAQLAVIQAFAPEEVSEGDIAEYTRGVISAYTITHEGPLGMKDMKPILALVKEKYHNADGKVVSQTLKQILGI